MLSAEKRRKAKATKGATDLIEARLLGELTALEKVTKTIC